MEQFYKMGIYDYIVIAFYFIFMLTVGFVFSRSSKNSSDYLRGGGAMTWWMTGGSVYMATFSAWTFVGCAGKIYKSGSLIILLFLFNAVSMLFVARFIAHRFRRLRAITPMEAVRQRFGMATQQVYAWLGSALAFALSGIMLYTLAVFIAPLLGIEIRTCIIMVGIAITVLSVSGGAMAVMASDFVQMLVIMTITIVAAVLVLRMPEVGGISGFANKLPSYHFNWSELSNPRIISLWIVAIFLNQFFTALNLNGNSGRFLCVQSDSHARKAALLVAVGFFVGPLVWFIPPMAASFVIPDIAAQFPGLNNPEEAAYAAICMRTFPRGLMGLLACGIFAATVSSMNTGLNLNSGIMVRSIYQPLFRKNANEKELLLASRIFTFLLGGWTILVGIWFSKLSTMPLFEWTLLLAGLISIPMTMPLVLGIFIKRTPGWSAWSTVVIGLLTAYLVKFHVPVQWLAGMLGIKKALSKGESSDIQFGAMVITVTLVTSVWFLLSRRFYRSVSPEQAQHIETFFQNMRTPIADSLDANVDSDLLQYKRVGQLSLIYGAATFLGVLIPNPLIGRLCFAFCGGLILAVGGWLYWIYLRKRRK
jgi:SSS family transporter